MNTLKALLITLLTLILGVSLSYIATSIIDIVLNNDAITVFTGVIGSMFIISKTFINVAENIEV